jgi:hypothetical protein
VWDPHVGAWGLHIGMEGNVEEQRSRLRLTEVWHVDGGTDGGRHIWLEKTKMYTSSVLSATYWGREEGKKMMHSSSPRALAGGENSRD